MLRSAAFLPRFSGRERDNLGKICVPAQTPTSYTLMHLQFPLYARYSSLTVVAGKSIVHGQRAAGV
jgi:hypothetical protein